MRTGQIAAAETTSFAIAAEYFATATDKDHKSQWARLIKVSVVLTMASFESVATFDGQRGLWALSHLQSRPHHQRRRA